MPTEIKQPLSDNTMIDIVDHGRQMPYGKVKNSVIFLGGQFYFKVDEKNLVKVKDTSGKKRLFRKNSKLVKEISPGIFVHKSQAVETEDGIWLDKSSPDTVQVNGKYTRKEYTVQIDKKHYLKTDPKIRRCYLSDRFILEADAIRLSPEHYKKERWISKDFIATHTTKLGDEYVLSSDTRVTLNVAGEEVYVYKNFTDCAIRHEIFRRFKDSTNPQLDRVDTIVVSDEVLKHCTIVGEIGGYYVHNKHVSEVLRIYNDIIVVRDAKEAAQLKAALKYSDDGPDENQAKTVKKIVQPWGGKHAIYTPGDMGPILSKTFKLTGGLKYTLGVEYETSQGLLPTNKADELKLKIVGDRSIGAAEYVTGVLHGDDGIKLIKAQCEALARYTFVDDRCGIHVHIGGMEGSNRVEEGNFGRVFAVNAIKLGCQLEEELYRSCPESRKPMLKHCHSILRWRDINEKNWREYLGAYVFGPEENWSNPWSFGRFKYGTEGTSKRDGVGDWCGGRYKWLNLVHILTRSRYNTCELRIFPGSTNFDKIYNYVMTSMAFVWFVDNRVNLIEKGGVTLTKVFEEAFGTKYPELSKRLITFYQERTKKFKRGKIYPDTIPQAIF